MSQNIPSPESILLPSELERRQIFYWLKRVSSFTAWNRILGYFQTWADIAEASVREAVDKGWIQTFDADGKVNGGLRITRHFAAMTYPTGQDSNGNLVYTTEPAQDFDEYTGTAIDQSHYRLILKGLAHMDEGVRRLRLGDKRVFQYNANGEFVMGTRASDAWETTLNRIELGEAAIDEDHTPHWHEFADALEQLGQAMRECWPFIIETEHPEDEARATYNEWLRVRLTEMHFPEPLHEVPRPAENLLVYTGTAIPVTGIWEPVEAPAPKVSLFRKAPPPTGPFPLAGCMNYLHGGSAAPQLGVSTSGGYQEIDVTWRLLWRDDRYEDGTVPPEEAGYTFQQPAHAPTPRVTEIPASPDMVVAETGQPAPFAGRWLVEHDLHASVTLQQGELLPKHKGHDVRWIMANG